MSDLCKSAIRAQGQSKLIYDKDQKRIIKHDLREDELIALRDRIKELETRLSREQESLLITHQVMTPAMYEECQRMRREKDKGNHP